MKKIEGLAQSSEGVTEVSVARDLRYLWRSIYYWRDGLDYEHRGEMFEDDALAPLDAIVRELDTLADFFDERADEIYGEDGASLLRQKMSVRHLT